jgi:lysophospholipase L1-like esterase
VAFEVALDFLQLTACALMSSLNNFGLKIGQLLAKLALVVFSLILVGLILEVAFRVAFYHSEDFAMEMWKYAVQLKRPVANPDLSFFHVANSQAFLMGVDVKINSQGLRDNEFSLTKPAHAYRILMLGDSTTFGWGVSLKDTAGKILERRLNNERALEDKKFEVINAGVGNYDTVQEVTYYETRGRAFHPNLVVLVYFINDPEPVPIEKKGILIDRSYLVAFVTNRFDGALRRLGLRPAWKEYYASLYADDKPGYQACKGALKKLASVSRTEGSTLLVALLPELHSINNDSYPFKAEHQKIRNVLAVEHVPVIDLTDGLKDHGPESTLWVTPLDDHPNAKANELIAIELQEWILKNITSQELSNSMTSYPQPVQSSSTSDGN